MLIIMVAFIDLLRELYLRKVLFFIFVVVSTLEFGFVIVFKLKNDDTIFLIQDFCFIQFILKNLGLGRGIMSVASFFII